MMKSIRMSLALLLLTAPTWVMQAQIKDKKAAVAALEETYNTVFAKFHMLLQRVTRDQEDKWQEYARNMRAYVEKNDKTLLKQYDAITKCGYDLLATLKVAFNMTIVKALRESERAKGITDLNQIPKENWQLINLDAIQKEINTLSPCQQKMAAIQKELQPGYLTSSASADVRKVLIKLAQSLETALEKVQEDYRLLSNKKQQMSK